MTEGAYRLLRRLVHRWVGPSKNEMMRQVIAADQRRVAEIRGFAGTRTENPTRVTFTPSQKGDSSTGGTDD